MFKSTSSTAAARTWRRRMSWL